MSPKVSQIFVCKAGNLQDGIDYFNNQLASSLKTSLEAFKTCRLFSPPRVQEIKPTASSLDQSLTCLPFLGDQICQY